MQKADSSSLFDELDAALQHDSSEERIAMLRQVTGLFLSEANRLSEEQVGVFDDVLVRLIKSIETRALTEISERLAPVANAPIDLTLDLARRSAIAIARPILTNSSRLTTADLVEIARTQKLGSPACHLGAAFYCRPPKQFGPACFPARRPGPLRCRDTRSSGSIFPDCQRRTLSGCCDFGRSVK